MNTTNLRQIDWRLDVSLEPCSLPIQPSIQTILNRISKLRKIYCIIQFSLFRLCHSSTGYSIRISFIYLSCQCLSFFSARFIYCYPKVQLVLKHIFANLWVANVKALFPLFPKFLNRSLCMFCFFSFNFIYLFIIIFCHT